MVGMGLGMVDRDIEVGKEYKIGTLTLNGVTYDRYVKVIDFGALPNNNAKNVNTDITGDYHVLSIDGVAFNNNSGVMLPLPRVNSNATYMIDLYVYKTSSTNAIRLTTYTDLSSYMALVTLEYYK